MKDMPSVPCVFGDHLSPNFARPIKNQDLGLKCGLPLLERRSSMDSLARMTWSKQISRMGKPSCLP